MKKITLLISGIAIAFASVVNSQNQKYVLFEHFTSATCGPCGQSNPTFQNGILVNNPNTVRHIAFHRNYPAPGTDPMYPPASTDIDARKNYYGATGVPTIYLNGIKKMSGHPLQYIQPDVDSALAVASPIKIETSWVKNGSNRDITVKVTTVSTPPSGSYVLRTAIVERMVTYTSTPGGTNGEKTFPNVFRKYAESNQGVSITLPSVGQSQTFNYSIPESSITFLDANQLAVIAYVQNTSTKFILNSGSTFDPAVICTAVNGWAKSGTAANVTSLSATVANSTTSNQTYNFTLTSNAPNDWSASFTINGTPYTSSATGISINAASSVPAVINVTPGTTAGVVKYTLTTTLSNNTTSVATYDVYVIANVTDLVISSESYTPVGAATTWQNDFLNALTAAGNTTKAATGTSVLTEVYKNGGLNGVGHLYYNAGYSVGTLTDELVANFTTFANAGGNFFICGQDIGWETWDAAGTGTTNTKAFYTNQMHATYVSDGALADNKFNAVSADPIFGGSSVVTFSTGFYGTDQGGNPLFYPDNITAGAGANSIYTYPSGNTGGVRYFGTNKSVYLAVGVEQFGTGALKNSVLKLVHDWFHGLTSTASFDKQMAELGQNFPNPSGNITYIPVGVIAVDMILEVTDMMGRTVLSQPVSKGTNSIEVNTSKLESGMYMYRLNDGFNVTKTLPMQVQH